MRISLSLAIPLIAGMALRAQAQDQPKPTLEDLKKQLDALREKHGGELDDLRFQVETLEKQLAEAQARATAPTAQTANVFNPGITVFGNFLARADDQRVFLDDDPTLDRIDNRFNLREMEVDMRAAIDPWADGVMIASFESEVPNEFSAEIEEGYVTLKKLPLLDDAPAGLKLKIGRFRGEFGRFNYIHMHDLPQPNYPRALRTFLGEEGYIQNGISGQFFLPSPSPTQTLEATVQVLDGGNLPIDAGGSGSDLAMLGHVKWFHDVGEGRSVELGASGWSSNSDHNLVGLDATYKWKPYIGGEWRSFLIGGELYAAQLDDPAFDDSPMGWYAWSQYQFDRNLYLGVRFDQAEELADSSQVTNTVGAFLTYYTTEFLRFRFGVEHAQSDLAVEDGRNSAYLELNFVFGSHPVEPYWVNR
jgi:hypothetical protein